jgi:ABC-2 type transport system permease protein
MASPRRWTVIASKLAITTATALTVGAVAVAGSLLMGRLNLPGNGFTPANGYAILSLHDDLTLRAVWGSVLYLGLIALLSAGVAAIVRDSAAAISAVMALLFLAPMLAMFIDDARWQHLLYRFAPMEAGLTIQRTLNLDTLHIGPWAGLGLLAAYAATAALLGGVLLHLRDA